MDTKALRQKILDLAIRGKLVPQDPNDEPASVLLERIRVEKQQMVKDGKLKAKDIKNDTVIFLGDDNLHYEKFPDDTVKCIEDEIPFELPEGWEWCRLSDVFIVCSSKRVLQSDWKKEGVPFYRAREIVKLSEYGTVENELFISEEHYNELRSKYGVPQIGDLMVSGVGTIGKVYVVKKHDTFYYKDASVLCFQNAYNSIDSEFAKYLLESEFMQRQMHSNSKGTTVDTITISTAMNYLFLLPPLHEQKIIVSKINDLLSLVNIIESDKSTLQTTIQLTKSKILDLAIRGKLVPQNPNDEPASVLLDRIRAEKEDLIKQGKIKRDKKESVIFRGDDNSYYEIIGSETTNIDDEIPFDLPDEWEWIRLGVLFNHNTGKALNKKDTTGVKMTYITTSNLYWDRFELDALKEMNFTESEIEKCTVQKGDLLVCEGGDIGRAAIWPFEEPVRIQNHIHRLRPYSAIATRFFYYTIAHFKDSGVIGGKGIGIQGLSSGVLHQLLLPLPPMAEQYRIILLSAKS